MSLAYIVREIRATPLVRIAYVCLAYIALGLWTATITEAVISLSEGNGTGMAFILGFGAAVLTMICLGELCHPEKAPYSPPIA